MERKKTGLKLVEAKLTLLEKKEVTTPFLDFQLFTIKDEFAALIKATINDPQKNPEIKESKKTEVEKRIAALEGKALGETAKRDIKRAKGKDVINFSEDEIEMIKDTISKAIEKGADQNEMTTLQDELEKNIPQILVNNIAKHIENFKTGQYFMHHGDPVRNVKKLIKKAKKAGADEKTLANFERDLDELEPFIAVTKNERTMSFLEAQSKKPDSQKTIYLESEINALNENFEIASRNAACEPKIDELKARFEKIKPILIKKSLEEILNQIDRSGDSYGLEHNVRSFNKQIIFARASGVDEKEIAAIEESFNEKIKSAWRKIIQDEIQKMKENYAKENTMEKEPTYCYEKILETIEKGKTAGLDEPEIIGYKKYLDETTAPIALDHAEKIITKLQDQGLYLPQSFFLIKSHECMELGRQTGAEEADIEKIKRRLDEVHKTMICTYAKNVFEMMKRLLSTPVKNLEPEDTGYKKSRDPDAYIQEIDLAFQLLPEGFTSPDLPTLITDFNELKKRWEEATKA